MQRAEPAEPSQPTPPAAVAEGGTSEQLAILRDLLDMETEGGISADDDDVDVGSDSGEGSDEERDTFGRRDSLDLTRDRWRRYREYKDGGGDGDAKAGDMSPDPTPLRAGRRVSFTAKTA